MPEDKEVLTKGRKVVGTIPGDYIKTNQLDEIFLNATLDKHFGGLTYEEIVNVLKPIYPEKFI